MARCDAGRQTQAGAADHAIIGSAAAGCGALGFLPCSCCSPPMPVSSYRGSLGAGRMFRLRARPLPVSGLADCMPRNPRHPRLFINELSASRDSTTSRWKAYRSAFRHGGHCWLERIRDPWRVDKGHLNRRGEGSAHASRSGGRRSRSAETFAAPRAGAPPQSDATLAAAIS